MKYDVMIVGGGIVGLSLGLALAQRGFSIALFEQQTPTILEEKTYWDHRSSTINIQSQTFFESLGLWKTITDSCACVYERVVVWESLGFSELTFEAAAIHAPHLGTVVPNGRLLKALWAAALQCENLRIYAPLLLTAVQVDESRVSATLSNEAVIQASLIIGADGAQSILRDLLGIAIKQRDYHQSTVVCGVKTEEPHAQTAWQRFLPQGLIAFLPLPDPNHSAVLWTTVTAEAEKLMHMEDAVFCRSLTQAFDQRLGLVCSVQDRQSFVLQAHEAKTAIAPRAALVGDAWHRIHPLAGQGLNIGLGDVIELLRILVEAQAKNIDLGHGSLLLRYHWIRKGPVKRMMMAMNGLHTLFGATNGALVMARSLGMDWINRSHFLKKALMKEAMDPRGALVEQ